MVCAGAPKRAVVPVDARERKGSKLTLEAQATIQGDVPRMAVVIPIFKQPALAVEAIESALAQRTPFDFRVVLVNDGCPYPETHDVCRSYVRAHSERVAYVRKKNGGLSSARNAGVDGVLERWPTVEAIQFLDADDRLHPYFMHRAFEALSADPDCGWVTPDITNFGVSRDYVDLSGEYSLLEHMHYNGCAVAGVIRRSVFETGLRYDEQMKLGYEDWDFWLSAAERGFRGIHRKDLGFQYRRRAESMILSASRSDEEIQAYIRRKHPDLYSVRRAVELEHAELPRFLIYEADRQQFSLATDPRRRERRLDPHELDHLLARFHDSRQRHRLPPFLAVSTASALDAIAAAGLGPALFWRLQIALESRQVALARVEFEYATEQHVEWTDVPPNDLNDPDDGATVLMVTRDLWHACLSDRDGVWLESILDATPHIDIGAVRVVTGRSASPPEIAHRAVGDLLACSKSAGPAYREAMRTRREIGNPRPVCEARGGRGEAWIGAGLFGVGPILPAVLNRDRLQVGYTLPLCEFGGVERVVQNLGRASRERGWDPHLFVLGAGSARLLRQFQDVFETVTLAPAGDHCGPDRICGLLGSMDVVVNHNTAPVFDITGRLRRLGVKTFAHLHSIITTPDGLTEGYPYVGLGLEHALDGVIVISTALKRWCRGWGVPESKLIVLRNGPSFTISNARMEAVLAKRAYRTSAHPLHVLYLGRFDIEKGMDRLLVLFRTARERNVPIEWRIVGKTVMQAAEGNGLDLTPLDAVTHPPALTTEAIGRHYAWADVLLLPSKFEGVPLSVLEAQQFGCVALATDVGALDEIVQEGVTGFLFSNRLGKQELADAMLERLIELRENRPRLLEIGHRAAQRRRDESWTAAFQPFAEYVESLVGKR